MEEKIFADDTKPEQQPEGTPEEIQEEKRKNSRRLVLDIVETLLLALVLYFGIDAISSRVRVQNVSMQPTLFEGEFVLVSKLSYWFGSPEIGDVVVFHAPSEPGEDFIKRVIGTPGDYVVVEDGRVSVNGTFLDEPYLADVPRYEGEWSVPMDSYFVLGDNRNSSSDSHRWGYVISDEIVGKAVLIYWPINKISALDHPDFVHASD